MVAESSRMATCAGMLLAPAIVVKSSRIVSKLF
jgi:hypothetical protein